MFFSILKIFFTIKKQRTVGFEYYMTISQSFCLTLVLQAVRFCSPVFLSMYCTHSRVPSPTSCTSTFLSRLRVSVRPCEQLRDDPTKRGSERGATFLLRGWRVFVRPGEQLRDAPYYRAPFDPTFVFCLKNNVGSYRHCIFLSFCFWFPGVKKKLCNIKLKKTLEDLITV
jgi:hypothetical protein